MSLANGEFMIVTRRGKQFNSIVHAETDTLNREGRDAVLIRAESARKLSLNENDNIRIYNSFGEYYGIVRFADIAEDNIQVYWPEANALLDPTALSPLAKIPAYKSVKAKIEKTSTPIPISLEVNP